MNTPHPWHYESDGEQHARTHYVWRHNNEVPTGIERKNFSSRAEALKFIEEQRPKKNVPKYTAKEAFLRLFNNQPNFMTPYPVMYGTELMKNDRFMHWELSKGRGIFTPVMYGVSLILEIDGKLFKATDSDKELGGKLEIPHSWSENAVTLFVEKEAKRWAKQLERAKPTSRS